MIGYTTWPAGALRARRRRPPPGFRSQRDAGVVCVDGPANGSRCGAHGGLHRNGGPEPKSLTQQLAVSPPGGRGLFQTASRPPGRRAQGGVVNGLDDGILDRHARESARQQGSRRSPRAFAAALLAGRGPERGLPGGCEGNRRPSQALGGRARRRNRCSLPPGRSKIGRGFSPHSISPLLVGASEGSPNGVLEAMAAGLAVAATDLQAICDLVGMRRGAAGAARRDVHACGAHPARGGGRRGARRNRRGDAGARRYLSSRWTGCGAEQYDESVEDTTGGGGLNGHERRRHSSRQRKHDHWGECGGGRAGPRTRARCFGGQCDPG